jgi:hypothetical protein
LDNKALFGMSEPTGEPPAVEGSTTRWLEFFPGSGDAPQVGYVLWERPTSRSHSLFVTAKDGCNETGGTGHFTITSLSIDVIGFR